MTAPAAPSVFSESTGDDTVILRWDAVPTATAYNVYQSATEHPTTLEDSVLEAEAQPDGSFAWESLALAAGDKAYFRVTSENALAEESGYSNEVGYGNPTVGLNYQRRW